jgi:hypothetical protein
VDVFPVSSASAVTRRLDAGVLGLDEVGVERRGSLPLAGVAGDCIGLASERAGRCCCEGVVDERPDTDGDNAERLRGLFVGSAERLPEPLRDGSGDSEPRDGGVRVRGL